MSQHQRVADLKNKLSQFVAYCAALDQPGSHAFSLATAVADEMDGEPYLEPNLPKPVVENIDALCASPIGEAAAPAIDALRSSFDLLSWATADRHYGRTEKTANFLDNFATAQLIGPPTEGLPPLWVDDRVRFGITVQGPNTFYPAHAHEAEEVYLVGAGEGW